MAGRKAYLDRMWAQGKTPALKSFSDRYAERQERILGVTPGGWQQVAGSARSESKGMNGRRRGAYGSKRGRKRLRTRAKSEKLRSRIHFTKKQERAVLDLVLAALGRRYGASLRREYPETACGTSSSEAVRPVLYIPPRGQHKSEVKPCPVPRGEAPRENGISPR